MSLGRTLEVQLEELPAGWRHQGRDLTLRRRAMRDGVVTTRVAREGFPVGLEFMPVAHELAIDLELRAVASDARTLDELLEDPKGFPEGMRKVVTDAGTFLLHEEVARGRDQLQWTVPSPSGEEAAPRLEVVPLVRLDFTWVFRTGQYLGGRRHQFLRVQGIADVHTDAVELDEARRAVAEVLRLLRFSGGENQALEVVADPVHPLAFRLTLVDLRTGAPGEIPAGARLLLRVWDTDQNTRKLQDHLLLDGERVEMALQGGKLPPPPTIRPEVAESVAVEDLHSLPDVEPGVGRVAGETPDVGSRRGQVEPIVDYLTDLQRRSRPLVLEGPGPHEVRLWLDFARLGLFEVPPFDFAGSGLPCLEDPTKVVVRAVLEGPEGRRGRRRKLARARHEARLEHVARVAWVGYETADSYDPSQYGLHRSAARRLPVDRQDLADYARLHEDSEGERRIRVDRRGSDPSFETLRPSGTSRGLPLRTGDWLRAGDEVHFDPTRMASHGFVGMQPPVRQAPAQLELSLEFLDGARGKLIVTEDSGPFSVTIGATAEGTGFLSQRLRLAYFAGRTLRAKLVEKAVVTTLGGLFPPVAGALAVADTASDMVDVVDWVFGDKPTFLPRPRAGGR